MRFSFGCNLQNKDDSEFSGRVRHANQLARVAPGRFLGLLRELLHVLLHLSQAKIRKKPQGIEHLNLSNHDNGVIQYSRANLHYMEHIPSKHRRALLRLCRPTVFGQDF